MSQQVFCDNSIVLHTSAVEDFVCLGCILVVWPAVTMYCVGVSECDVVAVDVNTLQIICHWKAADNCVSMLRTQNLQSGQSMLGMADLHSGITVYDLCVASEGSTPPFSQLYHVDVDEVRHFELVGACVAVFHRYEPNICFWNVFEQRTILCINVQEQARKLSEEFIVDNEEDADGTFANSAPFFVSPKSRHVP